MIRKVQGESRKILRGALVGEQASGKSTLISEACRDFNGVIIDTEEGTGLIRDPKTVCFIVDTFDDVIEAYKEALKLKPDIIAIDSISPPWKSWVDYQSTKYGDKIPIYAWNHIKRPWRNFIRLIQTSHISTLVTSRISYDMDTSGDGWKTDKSQWTAQAEKDFLYEMDVVIRMYRENGKYYGYVDKGRTRRDDPILKDVVGHTFENPTFQSVLKPFIVLGNRGTVTEFNSDDNDIESGNAKLDAKIEAEAEAKKDEAEHLKYANACKRGEKKCKELGLSGWKTQADIDSTRTLLLGTSEIDKATTEQLKVYVNGMKNAIEKGESDGISQ